MSGEGAQADGGARLALHGVADRDHAGSSAVGLVTSPR